MILRPPRPTLTDTLFPYTTLFLSLLGGTHEAIAHVAIGTSAATIIVTSIRSLLAHAKRGTVEFEILKTWAPWIILGDGVGVLLAGRVDGHLLTMIFAVGVFLLRSEERRVGKEGVSTCRSRCPPYH